MHMPNNCNTKGSLVRSHTTRQMLSASRGKPEYLNNVYSLHMYGTIYALTSYNVFLSYAGSESVYGGVDIEVVRHVAMAAVTAGSS